VGLGRRLDGEIRQACSISIRRITYSPTTDSFNGNGVIVAGNNANGTPGVSNTTLTGGNGVLLPRIGVAWSPKMFNGKVVVRAGWGMYYDRGELFSYLSPGRCAEHHDGRAVWDQCASPICEYVTWPGRDGHSCEPMAMAPRSDSPWGRPIASRSKCAGAGNSAGIFQMPAPVDGAPIPPMFLVRPTQRTTTVIPGATMRATTSSLYDEHDTGYPVAAPQRFGD
jgi:hypothetical protein